MVNASEALHIILEHTQLLGTEKVPLLDALGRTLGQDVVAEEDIPPFDNSAMDGFAIVCSDTKDATKEHSAVLQVVGESSAGNAFNGAITFGQAVRVMTGGMIPKGADAVVPIEQATVLDEGRVEFTRPAMSGQHIRKRGEDIKNGDAALHSGQMLTPGSIGVLASLGYKRVRVYEKPRVNIVATGDELVDVEDMPGKGQIRNSSSYALAAQVTNAGGVPQILGIVPDKPKKLRKRIAEALDVDVLLITGGVSVGKHDYVKNILADVGVDIKFWKVNIKPGMPLVFGTFKNTLVFGLPGNPVSTGVTFLQFVRPALLRMSGLNDVLPMKYSAVLDEDFTKNDSKRHFVRGIVQRCDGVLHVVTTGTQSSGAMSSLAKANCLIVIPEEVTSLKKGSSVEIELL
ncbi:MAG: moeA [Bacteroidetes bacterium]|nr:moeA [Bacteroidota bacterium]